MIRQRDWTHRSRRVTIIRPPSYPKKPRRAGTMTASRRRVIAMRAMKLQMILNLNRQQMKTMLRACSRIFPARQFEASSSLWVWCVHLWSGVPSFGRAFVDILLSLASTKDSSSPTTTFSQRPSCDIWFRQHVRSSTLDDLDQRAIGSSAPCIFHHSFCFVSLVSTSSEIVFTVAQIDSLPSSIVSTEQRPFM